MKQIKFTILGLLSIALLSGCGPRDEYYDDGDSRYTGNNKAVIRIHNDSNSNEDIWYVYLKKGSSYGSNILSGLISPGETESWNIYDCDRRYSIKVDYDEYDGEKYIRDKYIACGRTYTFSAYYRY